MAQVRASQRTDGQRSGAAFAVATAAIGALGARLESRTVRPRVKSVAQALAAHANSVATAAARAAALLPLEVEAVARWAGPADFARTLAWAARRRRRARAHAVARAIVLAGCRRERLFACGTAEASGAHARATGAPTGAGAIVRAAQALNQLRARGSRIPRVALTHAVCAPPVTRARSRAYKGECTSAVAADKASVADAFPMTARAVPTAVVRACRDGESTGCTRVPLVAQAVAKIVEAAAMSGAEKRTGGETQWEESNRKSRRHTSSADGRRTPAAPRGGGGQST